MTRPVVDELAVRRAVQAERQAIATWINGLATQDVEIYLEQLADKILKGEHHG